MGTVNRTPVPEGFRTSGEKMATQPQIDWIRDMLGTKNLLAIPQVFDAVNAMDAEEYVAYIRQMQDSISIEKTTMTRARGLIDMLKPLAYRTDELPGLPLSDRVSRASTGERGRAVDIVKGRTRVEYEMLQTDSGEREVGRVVFDDGSYVLMGSYGVDTSGDANFVNDTSFFKLWIQKSDEDYGKGWSLKLYVSDDTSRVSIGVPTQIEMLKRIAVDPLAASKLFGLEFKRCGVCGRGLTNDESRELGIGPVCGARLGVR